MSLKYAYWALERGPSNPRYLRELETRLRRPPVGCVQSREDLAIEALIQHEIAFAEDATPVRLDQSRCVHPRGLGGEIKTLEPDEPYSGPQYFVTRIRNDPHSPSISAYGDASFDRPEALVVDWGWYRDSLSTAHYSSFVVEVNGVFRVIGAILTGES